VAGLQTAKALLAHGFLPTIFEQSHEVGGVWRENYHDVGLQVPKQLYEFPGFPFESAKRHSFPTGKQVQAYVRDYSAKQGLEPVTRLNTSVTKVTRRSDGLPGWTLHTKGGQASDKEDFDFCVVCTGMYSLPNLPKLPGQAEFVAAGKRVVHSSAFVEPAKADVRVSYASALTSCVRLQEDVVVLGGGKSAMDIALDASKTSKSSTLVERHAHWATPRKIAGLIPFQYVFLSRFGQGLVSLHAGVWPEHKSVLSAAHSVLRHVTSPVFRLVEAIFAAQLGYKGETRPSGDVVTDFYGYAHVLSPEFKRAVQAGKVQVRVDDVKALSRQGVVLQSGKVLPCSALVLATGFAKDYSMFEPGVQRALDVQPDGLYLYRHVLPSDVKDLAFVGSEVATIFNIACVVWLVGTRLCGLTRLPRSTHHLQAEWLARMLKGEVKTPAREEMRAQVGTMKQWKRSWMPDTPSRAGLVLLHQIHYHDSLLQDMGMDRKRKGWLSEVLMPYEAQDWKV
jgi:dimethylaniline monooxygenase (N-oxide forming)